MSFQHKFHHSIRISKHVCLVRVCARHLILKGYGGRRRVLLPQPGNIPYSYRLIQRSRHNQVIFRMELRAHCVVIVTRHRADQRSILPIPDANGLIVRAGEDPGKLVVEEDGANVIEMSIESEEAPSSLVRPDLDFVVVPAGDEQRLSLVEVDSSDRTVVLFEAVYERAHAVVP